ncbi:hypothetical protein AB0J89_12045, partial [Micromonospora chokoriensis]
VLASLRVLGHAADRTRPVPGRFRESGADDDSGSGGVGPTGGGDTPTGGGPLGAAHPRPISGPPASAPAAAPAPDASTAGPGDPAEPTADGSAVAPRQATRSSTEVAAS